MAADAHPPSDDDSAARWLATWQTRNWRARLLWPASLVYGGLIRIRRLLYRLGVYQSQRLPCPVLVVGNVVVGGAGKTPTVIEVVQHLRRRGWTPGIVSRGHGRTGQACVEVDAHSTVRDVGDEPALLARATQAPTVVGRDRPAAARWLLQRHPEVNIVVCDDGMQHWALARDLTLVVFDERGCGNGWLLPAGLLREPWPAPPLNHEPLLVLQTQRPGTTPQALPANRLPVFSAVRALTDALRDPKGHQIALQALAMSPATGLNTAQPHQVLGALAGIAQPQRFFEMLQARGLVLTHRVVLPDHADTGTLLQALQRHPADVTWLCTEKDAVKLFPVLQGPGQWPQVWAVSLQQTPEPAFFAALDAALDGLSSRHGRQTS